MHADGSESKRFNIRDGAAHGVGAARRADASACCRRGSADATAIRAAQLGITIVVQGAANKLAGYEQILADARADRRARSATWATTCWTCRSCARAGFSAAPADAAPEVRARVHWVSASGGGRGAVRECIELVLRAQGVWRTRRRANTSAS